MHMWDKAHGGPRVRGDIWFCRGTKPCIAAEAGWKSIDAARGGQYCMGGKKRYQRRTRGNHLHAADALDFGWTFVFCKEGTPLGLQCRGAVRAGSIATEDRLQQATRKLWFDILADLRRAAGVKEDPSRVGTADVKLLEKPKGGGK